MAVISEHGGRCCGMRHISGFATGLQGGVESAESLERKLRLIHSGQLVEVVLNNYQMKAMPKFLEKLRELGFERVTVSRNYVHNSIINVFHLRHGIASDVTEEDIRPY